MGKIEDFIGIFNKHLNFIKKTTFPQYDQLYKKIICVTIIDTIASTVYPTKGVGDRFCDLLSNFTDYDFWNKVSPLLLYKKYEKNNEEIFSIFSTWNSFSFNDVKIGLIDDIDINLINSISKKKLEQFTHKSLLYKYRCSMIHEFKRPDGGCIYDKYDYKLPLYHKISIVDSNNTSIHLTYPLGFFIDLCNNLLKDVKRHYIKDGIDPFIFFNSDDLEIEFNCMKEII